MNELKRITWKTKPFIIEDRAAFDARSADYTSIYLTSRPRSGRMWMARLLSDVLDCAFQHAPGENAEWWGDHYDAPYVVRQYHTLDDLPGRTLFLYRDPRAVAVSAMHLSGHANLYQMLMDSQGKLSLDAFPGWREYMETWLPRVDDQRVWALAYEDLVRNPAAALMHVAADLTGAGAPVSMNKIHFAVARQSVDLSGARLRHRYGPEHRMVWRGKTDTWKFYFDQDLGKLFDDAYGDLMHEFGYITNRHWWQELPTARDLLRSQMGS